MYVKQERIVKLKSYRVGNEYRDRGGTTLEGDEFLAWINVPGSGMGNSEGIRSLRYISKLNLLPACLILVTHERTGGHKNPWDDLVDYGSGEILYWGDAKAHDTRRHSDFKGNKVLESIYNEILDGNRQAVPPILHFSKPRSGVVRFNGLCALEKLDLSWFDDHGKPVRNYRAHLTVLDVEEVSVEWLHSRMRAATLAQANKGAPAAWKQYLKGNVRKIDIWKGQIRSTDDQLPETNSDDDRLLSQLTALTPTQFEAVVVGIFRSMATVVHAITRTQPTADGGFDFYGDFVLPRPLSYRIAFRGEVKKYSRSTAVGPGEVSRLVARLGRGEYALFVTTSYFTKAVQKEVLNDGYPIKLICGSDLIVIMKELRLISAGKINGAWLASLMQQEFSDRPHPNQDILGSLATKKLIFLDFDEHFGFFIEASRYDFSERFLEARASAGTWREFLGHFSADEVEFLECFMESDEVQPLPDDLLDSLSEDVWILFDGEFPIPQFAEETYATLQGLSLKQVGKFEIIKTEYGAPIGIYETSRLDKLRDQLGKHGFSVEIGGSACLNGY
jgi:hypothetical protein